MNCTLCPRKCGVDRSIKIGFCGQGEKIKAARAALHFWEEPCISGTRGSGAVFFCGCNLKCVYCQNIEISRADTGAEISAERLAEIFIELQTQGAHNINLVTPTHYALQIRDALNLAGDKLKIPIVYNCGGYESTDTLSLMKNYIDIYLTDIKYADNETAQKYSGAADYCEVSFAALRKMLDNVGSPVIDGIGIMQRGVVLRHLVLPSHRSDSIELLRRLRAEFGTDKFILSLMSQYTPNDALADFPEINRRITSFEYKTVTDAAMELGFENAYVQERSSACPEYTPPFDLTGI